MSGNDRGGGGIDSYIDMIEKGLDLLKENEDLLNSLGSKSVDGELSVQEPLAEAQVSEDEVLIVAEVRDNDIDEMSVRFEDGAMMFSLGGKTYEAQVPPDVIEDTVSAHLNNGVLRLTVERMNEDNSDTIDVVTEEMENDDSIVDDLIDEADPGENGDNGGDDNGGA
jgi:HSP20 family molecular chaperone IbpA